MAHAEGGDEKPEFCPRMGNRIEISRRGAGARRGKIQKLVCLGFYSRGFASFAGKGGFAADLGRFGETTLPFFSIRRGCSANCRRVSPASFQSGAQDAHAPGGPNYESDYPLPNM